MSKLPMSLSLLLLVSSSFCLAEENQAPTVMNLRASQQGDCSNVVDIYYDLFDAENDACYVYVKASIDESVEHTWNLPAEHVTGDVTLFDGETKVATTVMPGMGKHIVWDLGKDADHLVDDVHIKIVAEEAVDGLAEMCFVPAGIFNASTDKIVMIDAFWIDKYEVTYSLYCDFLNDGNQDRYNNNGGIIAVDGEYFPTPEHEQYPVQFVTWDDAMAFCDWRSTKEGLPVGSYTLPTEAQWEKAAGWNPNRRTLYTYAFQSTDSKVQCGQANMYYGCYGTPTPVGHFASQFCYYGCFDMSGNVNEWCADWYGGSYPSGALNPEGPATGTQRVLRGGEWDNNDYYHWDDRYALSLRYNSSPGTRSKGYGFRCVRDIK